MFHRKVVQEELPEFYKLCHSCGDETLVLTEAAFNEREADLLGIAIQYANHMNKTVMILPIIKAENEATL